MVPRIISLVCCLLLSVSAADVSAMSGAEAASGSVFPVIAKKNGYVNIKGEKLGVWEPVVDNTLILSSDHIRTAPNSWARLQFQGGSIELYGSSLLYIPAIEEIKGRMDIRDVVLLKGSAMFDIENKNGSTFFSFKTGTTTGMVKGTLFAVTTDDDSTEVAVFRGQVGIKTSQQNEGDLLTLKKGQMAKVLADGSLDGLSVFNARKALLMFARGGEPDISYQGLTAYEEGVGSYDSDGKDNILHDDEGEEEGGEIERKGDDGEDDKDKDDDDGDDDKDKDKDDDGDDDKDKDDDDGDDDKDKNDDDGDDDDDDGKDKDNDKRVRGSIDRS